MGLNRRERWIAAGVALAVVAVGTVLFLVLRPASDDHSDAAPPETSAPAVDPPTPDDVATIEDGLRSGDPAGFARAVAVPTDQELDPAAIPALAALEVRIDPATFEPESADGGIGSATAEVTGPDGVTSTWTVSLVHDDGWRLVASSLQG